MVLQRAFSRLRASRFPRFSDSVMPASISTGEYDERRTLRTDSSAAIPEASSVLMASQSLLADIDTVLAMPLPVPVRLLTHAYEALRIV
jgi:hypothetical protein